MRERERERESVCVCVWRGVGAGGREGGLARPDWSKCLRVKD